MTAAGFHQQVPLRLVFLDIDGVLLPFGSGSQAGEAGATQDPAECTDGRFPDSCLAALARILRETGAKVVLSSTWRCAGGSEAVLEQFRDYAARKQKW